MTSSAGRRGRPVVADRQLIDEAAAELFLERGYAATSADDIARRAGVGRSSFFNCVPTKADVLWGSVDTGIELLEARCEEAGRQGPIGPREVVAILVELAAEAGPEHVPWAIAHAEVMGTGDALIASGAQRTARTTSAIRRVMGAARPAGATPSELPAHVFAAAVAGALAAIGSAWVASGPERAPLSELVRPHLERLAACWPELERGPSPTRG